jgi:hypothetical protein
LRFRNYCPPGELAVEAVLISNFKSEISNISELLASYFGKRGLIAYPFLVHTKK